MWLLGKLLVFTFLVASVSGKKYNISYELLSKCREFDAIAGYNYKEYFKIHELSNVNHNEDSTIFRLFVLGIKDAHILLSPNDSPNASDEVYEIVLGAGNNQFCEIRKKKQKNPIKTKITKDLLSPIDPLPLIIKLNKTGQIEVWIENEPMALLSVVDLSPVEVKYISFSSWGTTAIKWFFDCPDESNYDILDIIKHNQSAQERLEDTLFSNYDHEAYLDNIDSISIDSITFTSVIYNAKKESFELRFWFTIKYIDQRLKWIPEEFDNLTTYFDDQYIWIPGFTVLNGIENDFMDFTTQYHVIVNSEGEMSAKSNEMVLNVYCNLKNGDKQKNFCDMHLSVQEAFIFISTDAVDHHVFNTPSQSLWNVERLEVIKQLHTSPAIFEDKEEKYDIVYRFYLEENISSMMHIFKATIYGSLVLLMVSFWCDQSYRLALVLMTVFITILSMTTVNTFAPSQYVHSIIVHYKISLILAMLTLISITIGTWPKYFKTRDIPWWIQFALNETLSKCSCSTNSYGGITGDKDKEHSWEDVLDIINNIFFSIILIITIVLFFFGL